MWLQLRLYLLVGVLFAIVYALITIVASVLGIGNFVFYAILASVMLFVQYMIGPKMVEISMGVHYVSEKEAPELHRMVENLAKKANMKKPRVGISKISIPNAFAFGRSRSDGRVCVTQGLLNLLGKNELEAVVGHEISHLKNRDMAVITTLSVIPMIAWYTAHSFIWSGGRDRGGSALIGIVAFVVYFITNLLVLYASRIREYYADSGSVNLGNRPSDLASALYKLVYGNARVSKNEMKQMEGYKAFFLNDPSRAHSEIAELSALDKDMSGTIDPKELAEVRNKKLKLSGADRLVEILSTHPNMLKRIRHLAEMAG